MAWPLARAQCGFGEPLGGRGKRVQRGEEWSL